MATFNYCKRAVSHASETALFLLSLKNTTVKTLLIMNENDGFPFLL